MTAIGEPWPLVVSDMNFREQMQAEFRQGQEVYSSDFGGALSALKSGRRVCRLGWNGKGMWLRLVADDQYRVCDFAHCDFKNKLMPWIGMRTADDRFVPWLASQTDILAGDWHVLPKSDAVPGQPAT